MAKNEVTASLADSALDDFKKDVVTWANKVSFRVGSFATPSYRPSGDTRSETGVCHKPLFGRLINFPVNQADQAHGISIADLVKRGQANSVQVHDVDYDFPDGKDTGLNTDPLIAWKDPSEIFEMESSASERLQGAIAERRREAVEAENAKRRREAVKAENAKRRVDEAAKKADSSEVKEDVTDERL